MPLHISAHLVRLIGRVPVNAAVRTFRVIEPNGLFDCFDYLLQASKCLSVKEFVFDSIVDALGHCIVFRVCRELVVRGARSRCTTFSPRSWRIQRNTSRPTRYSSPKRVWYMHHSLSAPILGPFSLTSRTNWTTNRSVIPPWQFTLTYAFEIMKPHHLHFFFLTESLRSLFDSLHFCWLLCQLFSAYDNCLKKCIFALMPQRSQKHLGSKRLRAPETGFPFHESGSMNWEWNDFASFPQELWLMGSFFVQIFFLDSSNNVSYSEFSVFLHSIIWGKE